MKLWYSIILCFLLSVQMVSAQSDDLAPIHTLLNQAETSLDVGDLTYFTHVLDAQTGEILETQQGFMLLKFFSPDKHHLYTTFWNTLQIWGLP